MALTTVFVGRGASASTWESLGDNKVSVSGGRFQAERRDKDGGRVELV